MLDNIKGAIFGLAIGDALGAPTEFFTKERIHRMFGGPVTEMVGGGLFNWKPGETTDDTAMTLCVARGILRNPEEPIEEIGKEFMNWYYTNPKDIGNTCRYALSNFDMNPDWKEASLDAHYQLNGKSAGNGTLMRVLPVPLCYSNEQKAILISEQQSYMTHHDKLAAECCSAYTKAVIMLLNGTDIKNVIEDVITWCNISKSELVSPSCNPDGFVLHSLIWALHLCYTSKNYEEVVVRATNNGDDSDTIAAIAGGLYGTYCGFDQLPSRYVDALLNKDELDILSHQIFSLRAKNL